VKYYVTTIDAEIIEADDDIDGMTWWRMTVMMTVRLRLWHDSRQTPESDDDDDCEEWWWRYSGDDDLKLIVGIDCSIVIDDDSIALPTDITNYYCQLYYCSSDDDDVVTTMRAMAC